MGETDPIVTRESPWLDPWTGWWMGSYVVRTPEAPEVDHMLIYVRGFRPDDPDAEYVGETPICGVDGPFSPGTRVGDCCPACVDGVPDAFAGAIEAIRPGTR